MIVLLHIVLIGLLTWAFQHYVLQQWKTAYYGTVILKILAGILLGVVYTTYYQSGDTWVYHQESLKMMQVFQNSPSKYFEMLWHENLALSSFPNQPRAVFFSKILSVFALITSGNYWVMSAYLSLLSICASWLFIRGAIEKYGKKAFIPLLMAICWPSVLFWTSGITKENLAVTVMLLMVVLLVFERPRILNWLFAIILGYFLFSLKYYYAVLFFWGIIMVLTGEVLKNRLTSRSGQLVFIALGIAILYLGTWLHPYLHLSRIVETIVHNYQLYAEKSVPGGYLELPALDQSISGVLLSFPAALFAGLFRPLPTDGSGWLAILAGIENVMLLVLVVRSLSRIKSIKPSYTAIIILVYSFLLAAFLAMSAPNFGSLVRYKMGFLPFLLPVILWENPLIIRIQSYIFKR